MRKLLLLALSSGLAGCALADRVQSQTDYRESFAQYRACLSANPANPAACESLRLIVEADERRFTNTGAAMQGRQGAANINVR